MKGGRPPSPRWSVAVEVDVQFPAKDLEVAWATAERIAEAMAERMEGRQPPGWPRVTATVYRVSVNPEPDALLGLGGDGLGDGDGRQVDQPTGHETP